MNVKYGVVDVKSGMMASYLLFDTLGEAQEERWGDPDLRIARIKFP